MAVRSSTRVSSSFDIRLEWKWRVHLLVNYNSKKFYRSGPRRRSFSPTGWAYPGKPYWKGRSLSTVDLLVLTSIDQLLLTMQTLFTFFKKRAALMRRLTVLRFPHLLGFPGLTPPLCTCSIKIINYNSTFMSLIPSLILWVRNILGIFVLWSIVFPPWKP